MANSGDLRGTFAAKEQADSSANNTRILMRMKSEYTGRWLRAKRLGGDFEARGVIVEVAGEGQRHGALPHSVDHAVGIRLRARSDEYRSGGELS